MENLHHAMFDLETLGTASNSIILSAAIVVFDGNFNIGNTLKLNISLESSRRYGFHWSTDTLKWWMEQKPETLKQQLNDGLYIKEALKQIRQFLIDNKVIFAWGNSASFDLGLLRNYFERCNINFPIMFRNERCYRTLRTLFWNDGMEETVKRIGLNLTKHNPLHDCFYQISVLQIFKESGALCLSL